MLVIDLVECQLLAAARFSCTQSVGETKDDLFLPTLAAVGEPTDDDMKCTQELLDVEHNCEENTVIVLSHPSEAWHLSSEAKCLLEGIVLRTVLFVTRFCAVRGAQHNAESCSESNLQVFLNLCRSLHPPKSHADNM